MSLYIVTNSNYRVIPTNHLEGKHSGAIKNISQDKGKTYYLEKADRTTSARLISKDVKKLLDFLKCRHSIEEIIDFASCQDFEDKKSPLRQTLFSFIVDGILLGSFEGEQLSDAETALLIYPEESVDLSTSVFLENLSLNIIDGILQSKNVNSYENIYRTLYNANSIGDNLDFSEKYPKNMAHNEFIGLNKHHILEEKKLSLETRHWKEGWITWKKKNKEKNTVIGYKVYVSPITEDVAKLFNSCSNLFIESDATAMKIVSNREGIRRPDKIVVYFETIEYAMSFCKQFSINTNLSEYTPQGVPFTFQALESTPILSLGVDYRFNRLSWRQMICSSIAKGLYFISNTNKLNNTQAHHLIKTMLFIINVEYVSWRYLEDSIFARIY